MKTLFKSLSLVALTAVLGLTSAHASIDLTSYASQPGNSGDGTIDVWVYSSVTNYNASNTSLPIPGGVVDAAYAFKANPSAPSGYPTVSGQTSITIPTGSYDYVALHWGNGQTADPYQLYYIGTAADVAAGSVTFDNSQNGLSWYAVWTPTPDGQTAVPEPSTILAGMLLLIPLGVQTLRLYRQRQPAA